MNKIFVGRVTTEEMTSASGPWTKTKISFNVEDMTKLKDHMNEKGYVNLNFNRSQKGSEYMEIDTWQPTQQPQQPQQQPAPVQQQAAPIQQGDVPPPPVAGGGGIEDDVPFACLGEYGE